MKRAALYVRVSTEEQKLHGLSIDSQIEALKKYCSINNMQVVNIYNDAGISARKKYTKRPGLLSMIEDCQAGKVDIILMTKLDRFFRSVQDYYEVISRIGDIPWRTIWEDYETETSGGVLKVNIMLSVAQSEADKTSERIRSVFEYKRAKGDYIGTAPLGYKKENSQLLKDEATAPIIEELFSYYQLHYSVSATQKYLKSLGYNLNINTIRDILKKETYCGNAYGYETYAYISKAEHDEIIEMIESRTCKSAPNYYDYIFSGMVICGKCGCILSGKTTQNTHKDGSKVPCRYYSCNGRAAAATHSTFQSISEMKLENYLLNNLDDVIKSFNENAAKSVPVSPKKQDNSKKIIQLKDKLERVGLRFEDGDLSVEEYRQKRNDIQNEIKELQQDTSAGNITPIIIPSNWQMIYSNLDNVHKRAFWRSFIHNIIITNETRNSPKIIFK